MSRSKNAAPTHEDVLEELRALMESEFGLDPEQIAPTTHLFDDLDLDSIDLVDLTVSFEESRGFKLDQEELKPVETVDDAVDVFCAALARRSSGSA